MQARATLSMSEWTPALVQLAACHGAAGLDERIEQLFGTRLPQGPRLAQAGAVSLLGLSPGRWLALRDPADPDFGADLAVRLRPLAAVCDLSDAYVILRLCGAVRAVLARLVAIDLHEREFAVGQVAATVAAHMPVLLWRLPDEGEAVFALAVPHSYGMSLRHALEEAAAGIQVSGAG